MKKIVILGCENSHANSFLDFIRDNPKYSDVEVVGVYSDDAEAAKKLQEKYGVKVMDDYSDAVGLVDGVIVTARHGDNHYKYARPYISSGVPIFVDKPVTIIGEEALEFMKECKAHGVKITGGSSCKHINAVKELAKEACESVDGQTLGGFVRAPMNLDNAYGNFYFYSQHLVEMVMTIFGRYPKSVKTFVSNNDKYTVVFRYENYDVVGLFVNMNFKYSVMRVSTDGTKCLDAPVEKYCFELEFDEFYDIVSGGEQQISYKDFIAPIFALNAIVSSLESGEEVFIEEYNV